MAPVDILFGGSYLTLAPLRDTMVRAMDLMLVLPLVQLFDGGMIANGTMVITTSSSRMNSLAGKS